jgi:hypothetical protein
MSNTPADPIVSDKEDHPSSTIFGNLLIRQPNGQLTDVSLFKK